jgi:hypothetical protein
MKAWKRALLVPGWMAWALCGAGAAAADELFVDRFEGDLSAWEVSHPGAFRVIDSGDPARGGVLAMTPAQLQMRALVRGSERWSGYRVEGLVRFPTDQHNYLGFLYHYRQRSDGRIDTGSLYIKGNNSYIRFNPRRDWNPGRSLYEELRVPLEGESAIRTGEWQRFALEVVGSDCHLYVGDFAEPAITTDLFEGRAGAFGLKPRVVGGPVWVDDLRVTELEALTWQGERRPAGLGYQPERLVTRWQALGPLLATSSELEQAADPIAHTLFENGRVAKFVPFETDARGAVVTAQLVDFVGPATVGYFATTVEVDAPARFAFSSVDDTAIWVDGEFRGYGYAERYAWHDFAWNPAHESNDWVELTPGRHVVLMRVRGGRYASAGFFAALLPAVE